MVGTGDQAIAGYVPNYLKWRESDKVETRRIGSKFGGNYLHDQNIGE